MECLPFSMLVSEYRAVRLPGMDMLNQMEVVGRSLTRFRPGVLDDLQCLDRALLMGWRDWLLDERNVTRATYNNYHRHLRVLLNFGVEAGLLAASPLDGLRGVADYSGRKKLIHTDDVRTVVKFLMGADGVSAALQPGWFWCMVVRVLYYTGMRRRQLVSLQWRDLDFRQEQIRLTGEGSKIKREWEIPMPPLCKMDFENLRMMASEVLGRAPLPGEQVFRVQLWHSGYAGERLTVGQVSGFFKRVKERTGIEVSSHRFRHSFGTQAAKTGELKQVQAQLGHTSIKTTLEYVQADLDGMRRIGQALSII